MGDASELPLGEPTSLAYFWQVTDSQIVDEESPSRLINGDFYTESAYRMQESWTPHMLEATIRTGNDFSYFRRFDFALLTGDMIDNIHRNELQWFLEIIDGDVVDPDSGDDDDPIIGEENDQHDPFQAEGLDPLVPWYANLGNHDELELGNGPLVAWMMADPTGDSTSWLSKAVVPTCLDAPWYDTESPVPARCFLPPKSQYTSSSVVPDEDRAFISNADWVQGHLDSVGDPAGHGYDASMLAGGDTSYVVEDLVDGVPISLISMDLVSASGQWGSFGAPRHAWLYDRLVEAESAGRFVIVTSHHTAHSIDNGTERQDFVDLLHEFPGVIAHVGGHTHANRITARPAPTGYGPEHGYWEIETSAVVDWPNQSRLIEIVDNRDGTGDIICTMVDFQIPPDFHVVEGGRFYTLFDIHAGSNFQGSGWPEDRNVVLRFAWPAEIADSLAVLPYREVESFNFEAE